MVYGRYCCFLQSFSFPLSPRMLKVPFYCMWPSPHNCQGMPLPFFAFSEMTFQRLTFQTVCTFKMYPCTSDPNLPGPCFRMLTTTVGLLFPPVILDGFRPTASFYLYFLSYFLKFTLLFVGYQTLLISLPIIISPQICIIMLMYFLFIMTHFDVQYNCSVQNTFKCLLGFLFDSE